ncbi:hypothetical protein D5F11_025610 [Siminovitchia terrae]|uniref:Uncharacterized protein n=1 Tax=Siminovitchia terrae TaxID=1914933 RepID=A0A429X0F9_SIMTE|nr:manganese catalase family protein [Siminovitchia terrae]RST56907.1 hypothetical protein D5F11_025610 [Siminovitchia terrae]
MKLNQRYSIPDLVIGSLTDIGIEKFAHLRMIAAMVYKLTKDATPEQMKEGGLEAHYANYEKALFYNNTAGNPLKVAYIQAKGEPFVFIYIPVNILTQQKNAQVHPARKNYLCFFLNNTESPVKKTA